MNQIEQKPVEQLHPFDNSGAQPPFEAFLPFVQVNDESIRPVFTEALQRLYDLSGDTWRPGGCHSALHLQRTAETLQKAETESGIQTEIMTHGAGHHYFLEMTLPGQNDKLIIDPFGVPDRNVGESGENGWMANRRRILPFFGSIEQASEGHQKIYRNARAGYRAPFRA